MNIWYKKTVNTKSIGFSGAVGTVLLGLEFGIYIEQVTDYSKVANKGNNDILVDGIQIDNTSTFIYVEEFKSPSNPVQINAQ